MSLPLFSRSSTLSSSSFSLSPFAAHRDAPPLCAGKTVPPFSRISGIGHFDSRAPKAARQVAVPPPGVVKATQNPTKYSRSVYVQPRLPLEQVAAFMDTGEALADWLGDFLCDDTQADVRQKLARSGAAERHAFVILVGLSGVPFSAAGLLIADDAPLPTVTPDVPPEVTDAWAVSVWASGVGFRWSSAARRWQHFSKRLSRVSSP